MSDIIATTDLIDFAIPVRQTGRYEETTAAGEKDHCLCSVPFAAAATAGYASGVAVILPLQPNQQQTQPHGCPGRAASVAAPVPFALS